MEVKFKSRPQRRKPGAVRISNRIVTVASGGLEYEADQRHAEILAEDVGIDEGSRGLTTPGSNSRGGQDAGAEVEGGRGKSSCRAVAARGNYLGQDRMDMQFAAKEISRFQWRRDWQGTSGIIRESCWNTSTRSCRPRWWCGRTRISQDAEGLGDQRREE